jgi:hypothetical protein
MMATPIKKAAGGFETTTATASQNTTDFIAAGARQASDTAAFRPIPCHGIDRVQYRAVRRCDRILPGASNTTKQAGNLPDSEVFSRPEHYGFGRDGANRKAVRSTCFELLTSRPPAARSKAASGFSVQQGTETMTTVNTPPTPKMGNPSPLARQQAIENALSMALYHARHGEIHAATGRAIRAASMLKQACAESAAGSAA